MTHRLPMPAAALPALPVMLALLTLLGGLGAHASARADDAPWTVAGRQGMVQLVIVPEARSRDMAAYRQQIQRLCIPGETCFLNFYTNTAGAPVELPLPDAIGQQATAVFRRSMKQGSENFRWSCRMQLSPESCF